MKKRPPIIEEKPRTRQAGAGMAVLAAIVIVFTGLSYARNAIWMNDINIWENVLQTAPESVRAYNSLGLAFQSMSQYDKAAICFDKAIALDPAYAPAYVNRGVLRGQGRLLDKAIEDFNQSIAIDPKYAAAYSNRGIVYALIGQYGKALEDFNRALELNHDLAEVLFNRGRVYVKTDRKELAVADFQKACDLRYENACGALEGPAPGPNSGSGPN